MSDNIERATFFDGKQLWNKDAEVNNPFSPLIEDENPYLPVNELEDFLGESKKCLINNKIVTTPFLIGSKIIL